MVLQVPADPRKIPGNRPLQLPLLQPEIDCTWEHRGGPYVVSSDWWDEEVQRDYHFVETEDGKILWVFFDRQHEQWMVQGSA